jgi:HEAT repeat protein
MAEQPTWDSPAVFRALSSGRPTAKQQAITAIDVNRKSLDLAQLRRSLLNSIRGEFRAPRPDATEEDGRIADTRCWLLSALGRVAADDPEADREVRNHLARSNEPHYWARFWALEGLIYAQPPQNLADVAKTIYGADDEVPVVKSLAQAVLAANGDEQATVDIRNTLRAGESEEKWAVLRGLRVIPKLVPSVVRELCAIVDRGLYVDSTFDAIVALGKIPPDSPHAEAAAESLQSYLINHRWPMQESMRTRALIGLGNLQVERTAPVLIEELQDDSPAIVQGASQALEKVLGVRTATARLLEVSSKAGPEAVTRFANALRWMDRKEVVEALEAVILTTTDAQQVFARDLLSEVGGQYAFQKLRARTDAASKYGAALEQAEEKIRTLFETSILEAQHGFRIATRMDVTVFIVGVSLIGLSAALVLSQGQGLDKWAGVSGGAGVLTVLYSVLVGKPRDQVRDAVDHLMYLKVVFLGYLRQLHQTDQAFTRRLLDEERLPAEELKNFGDMVAATMTSAISSLSSRGTARGASANGSRSVPPPAAPNPAAPETRAGDANG